jgi:hypothetical protein
MTRGRYARAALGACAAILGFAPVARAADGGGTSGFHFLNLGTSARVEGVGRLVTTFSEGAEALEGNPARIGRSPRQVSLAGYTWLDGVTAGWVGGAYSPSPRLSLAVAARSLAVESFDNVTDDTPVSQEDFSGSLGASASVAPGLDVGIAGRFLQSELASRTASGWSLDAGANYHWVEGWDLVGAVRNWGPAVAYDDGPEEQLPTQASVGVAGRLGELRFGVESTWENGPGWIGILGTELPVRDRLRFRAGSRLGEGSSNAVDPWAVGVGIVARPGFEIDYAFRNSVFDASHRIGLRWTPDSGDDVDRDGPRSAREFFVDVANRAFDDAFAEFPSDGTDTLVVAAVGEHDANDVLTEVLGERLQTRGIIVIEDPLEALPADLSEESLEQLEAAGVATEAQYARLEVQVQESTYDVVGKRRERWIGPRAVRRTSRVEVAFRLTPPGAEEPTWLATGDATETESVASGIPPSPGFPQAQMRGKNAAKNPFAEPAIVGGIVAGLAIIFFSNRDVGN